VYISLGKLTLQNSM